MAAESASLCGPHDRPVVGLRNNVNKLVKVAQYWKLKAQALAAQAYDYSALDDDYTALEAKAERYKSAAARYKREAARARVRLRLYLRQCLN